MILLTRSAQAPLIFIFYNQSTAFLYPVRGSMYNKLYSRLEDNWYKKWLKTKFKNRRRKWLNISNNANNTHVLILKYISVLIDLFIYFIIKRADDQTPEMKLYKKGTIEERRQRETKRRRKKKLDNLYWEGRADEYDRRMTHEAN